MSEPDSSYITRQEVETALRQITKELEEIRQDQKVFKREMAGEMYSRLRSIEGQAQSLVERWLNKLGDNTSTA